jgi:hypothetical protein
MWITMCREAPGWTPSNLVIYHFPVENGGCCHDRHLWQPESRIAGTASSRSKSCSHHWCMFVWLFWVFFVTLVNKSNLGGNCSSMTVPHLRLDQSSVQSTWKTWSWIVILKSSLRICATSTATRRKLFGCGSFYGASAILLMYVCMIKTTN